jgi:peptide/nickel transport system permease protein
MSGGDLSREELEKRQKRTSPGYWAIVWQQLKKSRDAMIGLWIIALIVLTAFSAPLIANDQPIAVKYKGTVSFPAFTTYVDLWVPWQSARNAMKSWKVGDSFPFGDHYPQLEGRSWKAALADDAANVSWSVMPPVPWHPNRFDPDAVKSRPNELHKLGTDDTGRDVFARVIHGCAVAVLVGIISMGVAALIGITLGVTAGYFGGWTDLVLSRVTEIVMCFPTFFLIITVISFLERSIFNIMLVIGLTGWTGIFRLIRGEVLKCKALDYVMAAKALGIPTRRIMFRQILPNAVAPVFVSVAFGIAGAVLAETSLSFLGFGDTSMPSWGEIVSQGRQYVTHGLTYLVIWPGLTIFLTLTAFNLFGQGLRDAMDPRLRR